MIHRSLFLIFSSLLLLASIPVGVALVKQQVNLKSQASAPKVTSIEITGPTVSDFRTKSPQIQLQINYVPPKPTDHFPTSFRLANQLPDLDNSQENPFLRNATIIDWQLDPTPGQKTVYAQFKVGNDWTQPVSASIILDPPQ